ncbi:hypothetical protein D3C73_1377640 [compost metagenome]
MTCHHCHQAFTDQVRRDLPVGGEPLFFSQAVNRRKDMLVAVVHPVARKMLGAGGYPVILHPSYHRSG